jgi:putative transposase
MARANRYAIPGCLRQTTHRCHKKGFLLKFAHDRSRFVSWLGEARKRIGGLIPNTAVTSNLVHLPVKDYGEARGIGGLKTEKRPPSVPPTSQGGGKG